MMFWYVYLSLRIDKMTDGMVIRLRNENFALQHVITAILHFTYSGTSWFMPTWVNYSFRNPFKNTQA